MNSFHLHLVSDSTGETVSSVARAALAQFEAIDADEHSWPFIRTKSQVDKVLESIRKNPGFVMYTMSNKKLRTYLKENCDKMDIPCISVLSKVIADLSSFLNMKTSAQRPGLQHELDDEYFSRVEAINFALTHDDGQSSWDLDEADIVLIGVSRSSKSPTSMYLAYRGYRAANIPYVPGVPLPEVVTRLKSPLVVGLTISPDVLIQIRKNRLLSLNEDSTTVYTDTDVVKDELLEARRLFSKNNWPVIDVTRRSVEETAATIIQFYQKKKEREENVEK